MLTQIETVPDFRHVETWIFDLDNTLYPADSGLFAQIDDRMTLFVAELFGVSRDEARRIQKAYYSDHGTTLNGLMRLHGVNPETYLSFVHDIDLSPISRDPHLNEGLERLEGRRFVFTNGCRNHAERVLARLGIERHFDGIWDIRTIGYRPKPDPRGYETVLTSAGATASRAAMFEDAARNLVPAHALGMTTVWLRNGSEWSKQGPAFPVASDEHIHHEIDDLSAFLHTIRI
ncbi:MAG: pyrimidine 5'-nucleotidase [Rhizomicrobium sp.]|jgi:putative hydrolase of the HAD superfamily